MPFFRLFFLGRLLLVALQQHKSCRHPLVCIVMHQRSNKWGQGPRWLSFQLTRGFFSLSVSRSGQWLPARCNVVDGFIGKSLESRDFIRKIRSEQGHTHGMIQRDEPAERHLHPAEDTIEAAAMTPGSCTNCGMFWSSVALSIVK